MRIKKYYCRQCGQFRSILQVKHIIREHFFEPEIIIKCKYCNREVIETAPEVKKWLDMQQEGKK